MVDKKEAPKIPVMAFYHKDGLVPAWKQAIRFAGKEGRIATLPDIINARLATKPGSIPWERYFTTLTAEYLGVSRGGNLIIIVTHGVGPMATLDGILKAYSWHYKDKERNRRGGRISDEEFHNLESGKYGEVDIVDFNSYLSRYRYTFLEQLRASQAMKDPLLKARLGKRAEEYVDYHTKQARIWHREQAGVDPENRYNLSGHQDYCDRRMVTHIQMARSDSDPFIIQIHDASNCSYTYHRLEKGLALAHLISIGGLVHLSHLEEKPDGSRESYESLTCGVHCHEWYDGVRLVSIRNDAPVIDIHPGVDSISDLLWRNWQQLMKPVSAPTDIGLRILVKIRKNTWFTEYPKQGASMDTGEPEFHVTSLEKIGKSVKFVTTIGGYHMFFKYNIKEVEAIAPRGANAYAIVGDPEIVEGEGDPKHHRASVQFYRAEIDTSQRLIRENELCNDYETLMGLIKIK